MAKKSLFDIAKEYEQCKTERSSHFSERFENVKTILNTIIDDCKDAYLQYEEEANDLTYNVTRWNSESNAFEVLGTDVSEVEMFEIKQANELHVSVIPSDDVCRFGKAYYETWANNTKTSILSYPIYFNHMEINGSELPQGAFALSCSDAVSSSCSKLIRIAVEKFNQEELRCKGERWVDLYEYHNDLQLGCVADVIDN